jgi:hypothetical protein
VSSCGAGLAGSALRSYYSRWRGDDRMTNAEREELEKFVDKLVNKLEAPKREDE